MRLIDSSLSKYIEETHHLPIGSIYFFEYFVVTEFNEGEHIDLSASETFINLSKSFFSSKKAFGIITNRINRFSVNPLDIKKYSDKLENLESFCSITYNNEYDNMNVEIEKRFTSKPFFITKDFKEAFNWTFKTVTKSLIE
ncbi:hypothetical protein [Lacinutrix sp. MedPE-SW]|uniref:hypothetical protein n=1 Tax=Lacinutrix sp. MedPE-SW TaxID=1860087 RepID=UPI00091467ED|nr:hypothetical protein [Lacinutrix sp. MedPE-SW]OIQ24001.1 MAG: hypothetical protein BM549_01440 [Lacinutrix sp. MedPE-SW]